MTTMSPAPAWSSVSRSEKPQRRNSRGRSPLWRRNQSFRAWAMVTRRTPGRSQRISEPRDYAIFQNKGYQGLYGGLGVKEIHAKKGLKKGQKILDHMGSTELAANLFRATQTDEKLRRENIKGKDAANRTHYDVGRKVRQTIRELGGTMPEDLPTPTKSIAQIEREQKKKELKE